MKKVIFLLLLYSSSISAEIWQIGILSQRGDTYTHTYWQPWIDWLNEQFVDERFELVPLRLGEASQHSDLDFLLTNQSIKPITIKYVLTNIIA